jgi:glycosyltransferase involved in cell wall biosynthesis
MNVSVCLASYNGEKYLEEQLKSIINQLNVDDEIIIVDDFSNDSTVKVINSFKDEKIKIFINEVNKGHVYSFGKAISLATKDIIFMSDQDDIWLEGRVDFMKEKLINSEAMLVSSNSNFVDSDGKVIDFEIDGVHSECSNKYFKNIIDIIVGKTNYYGCTMVLKKELKELILPIPSYVESHDLWIAIAANISKSNRHLNNSTLLRRIHGENASVLKRKLIPKLWSRVIFAISTIHLVYRNLVLKK